MDAQDVGHDLVATGDGRDNVTTGSHAGPDSDEVDLGESDDWVHVRSGPVGLGFASRLSGGDGSDTVFGPGRRTGSWVFDNRLGEARRNGVVQVRWTGMERFDPDGDARPGSRHGSVAFFGAGADEVFVVDGPKFAGARSGAGDDALWVRTANVVVGGLISSGAGHDLLVADPIWYAGSPVADDTIRRNNRPSVVCHDSLFQVYGNRGNDQLVGSAWPDRLIGGPRNDRVNGNRGRDHCQAERAQNCEVMVARRRPSRVA